MQVEKWLTFHWLSISTLRLLESMGHVKLPPSWSTAVVFSFQVSSVKCLDGTQVAVSGFWDPEGGVSMMDRMWQVDHRTHPQTAATLKHPNPIRGQHVSQRFVRWVINDSSRNGSGIATWIEPKNSRCETYALMHLMAMAFVCFCRLFLFIFL